MEKDPTVIHWSAPEAFRESNPSINSNVWQFGMVLYVRILARLDYAYILFWIQIGMHIKEDSLPRRSPF